MQFKVDVDVYNAYKTDFKSLKIKRRMILLEAFFMTSMLANGLVHLRGKIKVDSIESFVVCKHTKIKYKHDKNKFMKPDST